MSDVVVILRRARSRQDAYGPAWSSNSGMECSIWTSQGDAVREIERLVREGYEPGEGLLPEEGQFVAIAGHPQAISIQEDFNYGVMVQFEGDKKT